MASALTKRALSRIADSGFARAKKLADLAIKTNTDSSGSPTSRGYEQAIGLLQPFISSGNETEALDAQRLVAGYSNSFDKIGSKQRDQNETVAAFKLQELDSYFSTFDGDVGSFRRPGDLVGTTSEALDNLTLGVINAIDEKEANGDSTDALHSYLNDLNKRSDMMRDLRNKFEKGELGDGQSLDGFGYYVDTNPLDGSVRGAALLPAGIAPDGIANGYRRLEATTKVGNALVPVYAPVTKNANGEYTARVGDASWVGTGDAALRSNQAGNSKNLFKEGQFDIGDSKVYAVRKNNVEPGSFGAGFIGRDTDGNPVETVFYRGKDNKLYKVDNDTLERFKQDPLLSQKLDGYVPRFSPSEVMSLSQEAVPFTEDRIGVEGNLTRYEQEANVAKAEADRMNNLGALGFIKEGFTQAAERGRGMEGDGRARFFENKNVSDKPQEPVVGSSVPDIVEQGKGFFRKAASFFSGRQ